MHQQLAQVSGKHKIFGIPFHEGLRNLVPESKVANGMLLLPHTVEVTRLARNVGFHVPAPIVSQYDWNGDTPFRTQKITAALLSMSPRAYVLSEMGTGKTRASLHAVNYLIASRTIRRALIVAPLSTLSFVWDAEIFEHFSHLSTGILHGDRAQRRKVLAEEHDVYIINHDGVEILQQELITRTDIDCIIIDELSTFKNAGANRWKAMREVLLGRKYVWGMTGTPMPNEPTDAWAQVRLLTPHKVPNSARQFRNQTMRQITQFKWIPLPDANEKVFEIMQPAVRFKRADCFELPPVTYTTRTVPMSAEQNAVYKPFMQKLKMAFSEGLVTAANEGVLYSKLLQIAAGWVYTQDRRIVDLNPRPRLAELMSIIDQSEGKVIVFADFIHAAHKVHAALEKANYRPAFVTGETPPKERNRIFSAFQNDAYPRVLVAHPKCMSHGLTLTAANTIVWYTPTTSLETYIQACARISRAGQTLNQLIVDLTGSPIENKLYTRLRARASLQGALLEMFEE